jgi:hypothetical protein
VVGCSVCLEVVGEVVGDVAFTMAALVVVVVTGDGGLEGSSGGASSFFALAAVEATVLTAAATAFTDVSGDVGGVLLFQPKNLSTVD